MSTPRSAYFTRSVKATFVSLIAITVIAGIFIKLRPNDRTENSASRAASAPGQSESDKVRGLTPPGSPKQDVGWQGWPSNAPPPAIAPFNAEQAKKHQEAWAKYLDVPVEYTNSLGMEFPKSWSDSVGFGSPTPVRAAAL